MLDKTGIRFCLPHLLQRDSDYKVRNLRRNVAQRWHVYLKILIGAYSIPRGQERREICVTEREGMSMEMKLTLY
jgi:hypothetical protein